MRITVLGATGRTGRHVVEQALGRGHTVRALVRDPARLGVPAAVTTADAAAPTAARGTPPQVEVVLGDVLDPEAVTRATAATDAVVVVLGAPPRATDRVLTRGTQHAVAAMHRHGVRRLVVETSFALDGGDRLAGPAGRLLVGFSRLFTGPLWADKASQEQAVRDSRLDWTLVRPTTLSDGPATGSWTAAEEPRLRLSASIPRADVAAFLLDQLSDTTWSRRAVRLVP